MRAEGCPSGVVVAKVIAFGSSTLLCSTSSTQLLNWLKGSDRKSTRLNSSHVAISCAVLRLSHAYQAHRAIPSFPTRRSSDLLYGFHNLCRNRILFHPDLLIIRCVRKDVHLVSSLPTSLHLALLLYCVVLPQTSC